MMSLQPPSVDKKLVSTIVALTWPQLCTLFCQFIIGFTDIWTGGRLGADVQASIGLISQCQMMLMLVAFATVNGAVAAVSQSLGAGRVRRAQRYVGLIIIMAVACGLIISIFGTILRSPILTLLHTPDSIRDTAERFITATMFAMPGHYGMVISTALFRSARMVFMPLYVGIGVCAINVVGDLGFGLGMWGLPAYGASGIAWSTTLAATLGALVLILLLRGQKLLTRESYPQWRWVRHGAKYLGRVMVSALGTSFVWQTGYMLMFIITASLPLGSVSALAGMTSGLRIEALLFLPATACSMTASVLVGNALGEGNTRRAMRIALTIVAFGCIIMTSVGAILWSARDFLASILTTDLSVHTDTVCYLTYNILAVPCTVATVILSGVFNGAGASSYPMKACLLSIWGVRLPLSWILGHSMGYGAEGIFISMLVSQMVQSSFFFYILFKCDWCRFSMRALAYAHHSHAS